MVRLSEASLIWWGALGRLSFALAKNSAPGGQAMRRVFAFTIIELLVVVTIIVVLLALLAPALDKAVYQAELAVCASRLKGIGTASFMYAQDQRRFYPSRPAHYAWDALIMRHPNVDPQYAADDSEPKAPWDIRPLFEPYMSLDQLVDPAGGKIKLDDANNGKVGGATGLRGDVHIYSNYLVYTGWKASQKPISIFNQRLAKLGDTWTFTEKLDGADSQYNFSILAADLAAPARGQGWALSSHAYLSGDYFFEQYQAQDAAPNDTYNPVLGGKFVLTFSYWLDSNGFGWNEPMGDYNYAYTDGSVRRRDGVRYSDDSMCKAILTNWDQYAGMQRYQLLPR
jgi:hypothetical protein